MWYLLVFLVFSLVIAGFLYLASRFRYLEIMEKYTKGNKRLAWILSFAIVLAGIVVLILVFDITNSAVCMLHLALFWILCEAFSLLYRKITKKKVRRNTIGFTAIGLTVLYLCAGWYLAHHVAATYYAFQTEKEVSPLKLVQISDSHIGTNFGAEKFGEYLAEIQAQNPDVVVITGDFVDDGTTQSDMVGACAALGKLEVPYGVYYAYGNHDKGYLSEDTRGWNNKDLERELEKNGVVVLQDKAVPVGEDYYLMGRQDKSTAGRASMEQLTADLDMEKYIIVLDHQPCDYKAQEEAKVDLVLSGHTHGGQMIPINYMGEWLGINGLTYGHKKKGQTDFIVNSGIGGWDLQFKTGCGSEYVVVEINKS
ncbi:MAG: metallophosphoesterase [Blautia sp.]|nr:metallophosphoesterase [Blautia sp.]